MTLVYTCGECDADRDGDVPRCPGCGSFTRPQAVTRPVVSARRPEQLPPGEERTARIAGSRGRRAQQLLVERGSMTGPELRAALGLTHVVDFVPVARWLTKHGLARHVHERWEPALELISTAGGAAKVARYVDGAYRGADGQEVPLLQLHPAPRRTP